MLAAAEVALHLEQEAKSTGSVDTVATTGAWHIKSNTINAGQLHEPVQSQLGANCAMPQNLTLFTILAMPCQVFTSQLA